MATTAGGATPAGPSPEMQAQLQGLGASAKAMSEQFTAMSKASNGLLAPFQAAYQASAHLAGELDKLNGPAGQSAGKLTAAQEQARKLAQSLGLLSGATGKLRPDIQAQVDSTLAVGNAWERFKNQLALVGMQIVSTLSPILIQMVNNLHPVLVAAKAVADWFSNLDGVTKRLIVGVGVGIFVFGALTGAIGTVVAAVAVFGLAIGAAVAVLGSGVVIAAAVAAALITTWVVWGDKITAVFDGAVSYVSGLWEGIVAPVRGPLLAVEATFRSWIDSVKGALSEMGAYLANLLPDALALGLGKLTAVAGAVYGALQAAFAQVLALVTGVVTTQIPAAFAAGWEIVKSGAVALGNFLGSVLSQALNGLLGAVQSFGQQIAGMIGSAVSSALGFFSDLWTFLSSDLPSLLAGFPTKLAAWANAVGDWAWNAVTQFVGALKGLPGFIENELLPRLIAAGKAIWQNLVHGLYEAMRAGAGVARDVMEWFHGLFGPDGGEAPKQGPVPDVRRPPRTPAHPAPVVPAPSSSTPIVAPSFAQNRQRQAATINRQNVAVTQVQYNSEVTSLGGSVAAAGSIQGGAAASESSSGADDKAAAVSAKKAAAGNPTGFFAQAMKSGTDAMTQFRTSMVGVVGQFTPMGIVAELLGDVFKGMQPAIDSLKAPLKLVAQLFGAALAPVLRILFPVFKFAAIAATYVGQIFFTVAGGIAKFIGGLIAGVGKAISKIPFLGGLGKTIQKAGENIENVGKGMQDGAKELAKGREELQAMQFGDTADKVQKLNESLTNTPEGFKVALARFQATAPQGASVPGAGGGDAGSSSGGSDGTDGAPSSAGKHVSIGHVQIVSNDPEDIWKKLKRVIERENNRSSGSLYSPAPA